MTGTSPFVRQCRVVIRERQLSSSIEEIQIGADADSDRWYLGANPAGHGPALAYEGGALISPIEICRFLDLMGDGPSLSGKDSTERLAVSQRLGLALAAIELAVRLMHEIKRPAAERSALWLSRWRAGLNRTLDRLESLHTESPSLDLGEIATVIALTYLDFRLPDVHWRDGRPRLESAQVSLEKRHSFKATHPAR
jgi:glutathione S-transferase